MRAAPLLTAQHDGWSHCNPLGWGAPRAKLHVVDGEVLFKHRAGWCSPGALLSPVCPTKRRAIELYRYMARTYSCAALRSWTAKIACACSRTSMASLRCFSQGTEFVQDTRSFFSVDNRQAITAAHARAPADSGHSVLALAIRAKALPPISLTR